jgi:hypothetical protein
MAARFAALERTVAVSALTLGLRVVHAFCSVHPGTQPV